MGAGRNKPMMSRAALLCLLVLALVLGGCKKRVSPATTTTTPPVVAAVMPPGYVEARVLDVVAAKGGGNAVLVLADTENLVMPIYVGDTEAMTIQLRFQGKHYVRPLTHDLLSQTIKELGGRAIKVQVDDLRDNTYIGTAFIERNDGSVVALDARPSDCIALALGAKIPIYVKRSVLVNAGIPRAQIEGRGVSGRSGSDPADL